VTRRNCHGNYCRHISHGRCNGSVLFRCRRGPNFPCSPRFSRAEPRADRAKNHPEHGRAESVGESVASAHFSRTFLPSTPPNPESGHQFPNEVAGSVSRRTALNAERSSRATARFSHSLNSRRDDSVSERSPQSAQRYGGERINTGARIQRSAAPRDSRIVIIIIIESRRESPRLESLRKLHGVSFPDYN